MSLISIKNLTISFKQNQNVVNKVNLEIQKGKTVAIVGESGSGKTLSALSILKLLPVNAKINSEIEIYSTSGVRIFIGKYEGFPINIEQLSDGLYFVKINNTTLKVIIKH